MVNDQGIGDRGYNPSSSFFWFTGRASLSLQMCYGRVASRLSQNNLLMPQCYWTPPKRQYSNLDTRFFQISVPNAQGIPPGL